MPYQAKPISFKPPRLKGLSAKLIASHYENNYGGAVRRLNAIRAELAAAIRQPLPFRLNGLKREELIATNSMLLHEAYFEAMGEGGGGDPTGALAEAMARDFGSVAKWRAEFVAMGKALRGGSGWVLLTRSPRDGTLSNVWAADHTHTLAGGTVVLALDMYEHSYALDFGANADGYVEAFMANIAWERIANRFAGTAPAARPHTVDTQAARRADRRRSEDLRDRRPSGRRRRIGAGAPAARPARAAQPGRRGRSFVAQGRQGRRVLRLGLRDRRRLRGQAARARHRCGRGCRRHRHLAGRRPADRTSQGRRTVMKWVTRERPKIDRIACPWLIQRFIEKEPEFLYVPADQVLATAKETGAIPYDIPGVKFSHVGDKCSFDAFIAEYKLDAPGPRQAGRHRARRRYLQARSHAAVVRAVRDLARPQPLYQDDHEMLRHGMVMYDALYAWCRSLTGETHNWPPKM